VICIATLCIASVGVDRTVDSSVSWVGRRRLAVPSRPVSAARGVSGARGSSGAGWYGAYGWVVEFRVLGPVEVYSGNTPVHVGGVKQRSILALLIASHGQTVTADRIVGEVYGEDTASGARRSVQTIISMLRREFGDVIVGTGDGYRFDSPRTAVDACRFEDGVAEGLALVGDDPRQASSVFDEALGLWQGDPYGDVDGRGAFEPEAVRLTELRFAALEARAEADLACGRHREVVAELEALVGEYPLRERLWGWLMLALYRTGRQADGLAAYQRVRTVLGELGLEPSTELRELEGQILLQDESLDLDPMVPHNLPAPLTSFVGRQLELIELGERLSESRLVTLTGAGGSGKTRLAIELGRAILDDYPDGVWFVDLRGASADGVAPLIASTLGVITSGDTPIADQLVDAVAGRRLLLVLDNCEHVLDAAAPLVERLASRDGPIRVLATSREPVGVPGESTLLVRPLLVPERASIDDLADSDAAVLFAQRAGNTCPDFAVEEHVASVFEICRSVEGLPLALELAAARLNVFSPEELADRLYDQTSVLKTSQRAGDLRHSTIESTIRWSWDLLDDVEQVLFSRLSVFPGTWSLSAAEAICGFDPVDGSDVADLVGGLVEKSLVVAEGVSAGSTRFRLLEPIRQYASGLVDNQAAERFRDRLVDYWSATLERSYGPDARFVWRNHEQARALEADRPTLIAAVEWSLEVGRFEDAMRVFSSLFGGLLLLQGSGYELASRWLAVAVEHRQEIAAGVLLSALEVGSSIAYAIGDFDAASSHTELGASMARTDEERRWFELAAAMATNRVKGHSNATSAVFARVAREADSPGLRASALLAEAHNCQADSAWMLSREAMELPYDDSPRMWDEPYTAFRIFDAAEDSGHYDVAVAMAEHALDLSRRQGWLLHEHQTAGRLARLHAARGNLDEAAALISEAVSRARNTLGPPDSYWDVLEWAAYIARLRGELDKARDYVDEALSMIRGSSIHSWKGGTTLVESALVARDEGDLEQAQRILDDAAERLRELVNVDLAWWVRFSIHAAQASIALRRTDPRLALEFLRPVLTAPDELTHEWLLEAVDLVAIAFAQQERAELAARLKGSIDRERDESGLAVHPPDEALRDEWMRHAQSFLIDDWDAAVERGRAMTLEDAVELANTEAHSGRESRPAARQTGG